MSPEELQAVLPLAVPIAVFVLVLLRNRRARRLRLQLLWIMPALFVVIAVALFAQGPAPGALELAAMAACLAAGAALGWTRGRSMEITVDLATRAILTKASPWGIVLLLAFFVLRFAGRLYVQANPEAAGAVNPMVAAHLLLMFGLGLIVTQRAEMWLRARRMLAEAQG